ncbi:uncharacterized protein JCM15063_002519 [Sporobolomyces koalae]|uniref:uncharacterized protein n=1 Tax=Sporobolomyces koalae TaxID=500713 RepID=UPI00317AB10F
MATRRNSSSPHPPPLASTSYLPAAATTPTGGATGQDSEDPFLAQTAAIPLTERDRQEGYDVELLNARPRGAYSDSDRESVKGQGALAGGGLAATSAGAAALAGGPTAPPIAGIGTLPGGGGAGLGGVEGGNLYGKSEYGPGGGVGNSRDSGTTARTGKRRPWFLRPLPLGILIGFIVAVALAIGLGVGLSERNRNAVSDAANASRGTSYGGSRSRTGSRTRTSTATTGTVVPSSLYSSYTSDHPQSEETTRSSTVDASSTDSALDATRTTTIPSPASGTTLASTGNLPIPAESATTISGSITVSRLSPSDNTDIVSATITARAKNRKQRRWTA